MRPKIGILRRSIKINKPLAITFREKERRHKLSVSAMGEVVGIMALHTYVYLHSKGSKETLCQQT